jgi:hypothetical protein
MDTTYLLTESSGWVIAGLTVLTIVLPYLFRRRLVLAGVRLGRAGTYLERLSPHYTIGLTIAGLSLVHAGLAVSSAPTTSNPAWAPGIWVATGALFLVFGQLSVGLGLRDPREPARRRQRRVHFAFMTVLVVAGAVHLLLNGPLTRAVLRLS